MDAIVQRIRAARAATPAARCTLVGLSGIDGSGKGYVSDRLVDLLRREGVRAVAINGDAWQHLPDHRFSGDFSPLHYFDHGFRFDELFDRLVLPLKATRSVRVEAELTDETASAYRPHLFDFRDVDVAIVEAIFLFQPKYRGHFDLAVWLDCTFETARERVIARAQEGLPPAETARRYDGMYFPAQRIHAARDAPAASADLVFANDHRLGPSRTDP